LPRSSATATPPTPTLGEGQHLSASQISRRIQRLEEAKVITGYAALLDPLALGLGVTAFAHVHARTPRQDPPGRVRAPGRGACRKCWNASP
jgi:DNA-binding Lrp family transcriptional regulator